jgi:hypothetical protein
VLRLLGNLQASIKTGFVADGAATGSSLEGTAALSSDRSRMCIDHGDSDGITAFGPF